MTVSRPAIIAALAASLALAVVLFAPQVLNDGDTYWHIATGRWILDHGAVPKADVFSYTRAGAPWQAHEWLSEVAMALSWRAAGWSGVVVLFGIAAAATAGQMALRLGKSLNGLALVLTLIVALASTAPSLLARPHLLVLPVLVAWLAELLAARDENRPPRLVFALLMLLWANLHGSYVFGFLLAAPFGLEALLAAKTEDRFKVLRGWGLFGVASLAVCLITPHGLAGLIFPFKLMTMSTLYGIVEWQASDFSKLGSFEIALLATLFVCLSRGVKIPVLRLLLLLFLVHMALQHSRHLLILAMTAPLILAQPLGEALGQTAPPKTERDWRPLAAFVALAWVLCGARVILPLTRVDNLTTPMTALAHVPGRITAMPVLNDYGFGGYLIYRGVKPYIDGRADMYGDDFDDAYFKMLAPDPAALDKTLEVNQVAWTILPPNHPLAPLMAGRSGWTRTYSDRFAVVDVRDSALAAP